MNKEFVRTHNYNRLVAAMEALQGRDESLPGLGLIYGKTGYGKSESVDYYYGNSDTFYMVLNKTWKSRRILEEICDMTDQEEPEYRLDRLFDQAAAGLTRLRKPLFIDEADYLFDQGAMLDIVRDLHDNTGVPIILIGMEVICKKLRKRPQFFSRILPSAIVEFQPISLPELVLITKEWTGLSLDLKTAEVFLRFAKTDFRYVVGYLLSLEQACQVNQTTTITAKMIRAVAPKVENMVEKQAGTKMIAAGNVRKLKGQE